MAQAARPSTVDTMDALNPREAGKAAAGQQKLFRDLRARNERRVKLARVLDAQRRQRVERVMQVARQRRFRKAG